jgi:transcriptional regulator with XRE-family HTH domain
MDTNIRKRRSHKPDDCPNRLRFLRVERDLTLQQVASAIGVSPQAVFKAETLGKGLNRKKWYQLADLFNVDPRVLETPVAK